MCSTTRAARSFSSAGISTRRSRRSCRIARRASKHIIAMDGGHATWPEYETWRDAQETLDPQLAIAPEDDVIQLYTSGTTGHPKGVQLTNANYLSIFTCLGSAPLGRYEPEDVVLIAMPFFHVAGVNIGLLTLAQGAQGVVLGETDPAEILRLIGAKKVSYAFCVPALILFVVRRTPPPRRRISPRSRTSPTAPRRSPTTCCCAPSRSSAASSCKSMASPRRPAVARSCCPRTTIPRAASCAPAAGPRPDTRSASSTATARSCPRAKSARSRSGRPM